MLVFKEKSTTSGFVVKKRVFHRISPEPFVAPGSVEHVLKCLPLELTAMQDVNVGQRSPGTSDRAHAHSHGSGVDV